MGRIILMRVCDDVLKRMSGFKVVGKRQEKKDTKVIGFGMEYVIDR